MNSASSIPATIHREQPATAASGWLFLVIVVVLIALGLFTIISGVRDESVAMAVAGVLIAIAAMVTCGGLPPAGSRPAYIAAARAALPSSSASTRCPAPWRPAAPRSTTAAARCLPGWRRWAAPAQRRPRLRGCRSTPPADLGAAARTPSPGEPAEITRRTGDAQSLGRRRGWRGWPPAENPRASPPLAPNSALPAPADRKRRV